MDEVYEVPVAVLTVETELQVHWLLQNLVLRSYVTALMRKMVSPALCD